MIDGKPKYDPIKGREKQKQWCKKQTIRLGKHPLTHRREIRKKFLIDLLGGVCQGCGYKRCQKNLAFHHLSDKTTGISGGFLQKKLAVVVTEVEKCVLLCHNCHGEVHDNIGDVGVIPYGLIRLNEFVRKVLVTLRDKEWESVLGL